jgi:hypothetical protein
MRLSTVLTGAYLLISFSSAQNDSYDHGDYNDYAGDYGQQDNLYHDYAERQQTKE